MLKILVSLFLVALGIQAVFAHYTIYCDDDQCKPTPAPEDFPETNEELQKICTPAIEFLGCKLRHIEGCETRDPESELMKANDIQIGSNILGTIKDICSEDTLLHAAIVDSLKCMKKLANDSSKFCVVNERSHSEDRIQQFSEALAEEGIVSLTDNENDISKLYECIDMMNFFACHSVHIENECGTVAMDAYVEVVQRMGTVLLYDATCDESSDLLPALIRLHKVEQNVAEAFRKKK